MKNYNLIALCFAILFTASPLLSSANDSKHNLHIAATDNVSITIDSKTTDTDFKSITEFLQENGIIASFSNIRRNEEGLITGIKIKLQDTITNNSTVSNSSSNTPINKIVFGRKNGRLYFSQHNRPDPLINQHRPRQHHNKQRHNSRQHALGFNADSIMKQHFKAFDQMFEFDEEHNSFTFNGQSFSFDEMQQRMRDMFQLNEDENGNRQLIIQGFGNTPPSCASDNKSSFRFNDPIDSKKHIIIDGHTSSYETLKKLSLDNKLETVDKLKPQTAKSLYGKKGKMGAIIATIKK